MEEEVVEVSRAKNGEKTAVAGKFIIKVWVYNGKYYLDGYALKATGLGDKVKGSLDSLYEVSEMLPEIAYTNYTLDHRNDKGFNGVEIEYFDLPEVAVDLIYAPYNNNLGSSKGR